VPVFRIQLPGIAPVAKRRSLRASPPKETPMTFVNDPTDPAHMAPEERIAEVAVKNGYPGARVAFEAEVAGSLDELNPLDALLEKVSGDISGPSRMV
jgi:hypothetical protein